jgi:hypothetical protein
MGLNRSPATKAILQTMTLMIQTIATHLMRSLRAKMKRKSGFGRKKRKKRKNVRRKKGERREDEKSLESRRRVGKTEKSGGGETASIREANPEQRSQERTRRSTGSERRSGRRSVRSQDVVPNRRTNDDGKNI